MTRVLKPPNQALGPLKKGLVPKPGRIKARCKHITELNDELSNAQDIKYHLLSRDSRTVGQYYEALARLKISFVELENCIEILENELF